MSKRVEILNIRLNQLRDEKNKLDTRTHKLRMRKQNEQKLLLGSYFSVSNDKFECTAISDTRVTLNYEKDSYGAIVSYELQDRWSRDEKFFESRYHLFPTYHETVLGNLVYSLAKILILLLLPLIWRNNFCFCYSSSYVLI